jgi:adenylosuccinate synthase
MPVDIVTGGFFGDEGKGKIVAYLTIEDKYDIAVKAGSGPQSGHTAAKGKYVQLLPSGFMNENTRLLIGRGTVVNPEIILKEIEKYGTENRTGIDRSCTVIEPIHIEREQELKGRIGSVGVGTGFARVDRILRKAKLAKDIPSLKPYITNVAEEIDKAIQRGKKVILEGTQGLGLSLFDADYYPYVTSQDTTASQIASDAGVAPKDVGEIYTIFKAFVSRVGEGKGQEALRTLWTPEQQKEYGIEERGTVSGRPRKLGNFDDEMAIKAIIRNSATQGAITNIDRLFKGNDGVTEFSDLTPEAQEFINEKRSLLRNKSKYFRGITLISTGPNPEDIIDIFGRKIHY